MAEETLTILKVGTEDAVRSIQDLKDNIKILKDNLSELEIGSDEYADTLNELRVNQNALKDAMYATSASLEDVAASATGASESYNSLVHRMAALKEEWRSTNNEARRNELGKQIADINQQLKDMDASVGNFQRNVGNYESGVAGIAAKFEAWGSTLKAMPPTLGAAKEQLGRVGETMQLVGKQPILGMIGLLAPVIMKITASLKDNETAMSAIKNLMASLQPLFDVLAGVLEAIATGLSKAVGWFVQLVGQADGMKNLVSSVVGVGNAILQYLLTPIKTAVSAFKGLGKILADVFTGNFSDIKAHAQEAGEDIASAWKEGFSFKANFEEGKAAGAQWLDGMASNETKAEETGTKVAISFKKGYDKVLENIKKENEIWADEQRAMAEEDAFFDEYLASQEDFQKESNDLLFQGLSDRYDAQVAAKERELELEKAVADEVTAYLEEQNKKRQKSDEEQAKAKVESMYELANVTSGILGTLAELYESDEKSAEKNAKKIKALRVAEATINTISGAIGAYMQAAATIPPPYGVIVGAAQSAAITAAGVAQIAKMKGTSMTSSGVSSSSVSVSAPQVDTSLPSVRNITSASEEDRLNRMAQSQKVYILQSDIEAAGAASRARVAESSF